MKLKCNATNATNDISVTPRNTISFSRKAYISLSQVSNQQVREKGHFS